MKKEKKYVEDVVAEELFWHCFAPQKLTPLSVMDV